MTIPTMPAKASNAIGHPLIVSPIFGTSPPLVYFVVDSVTVEGVYVDVDGVGVEVEGVGVEGVLYVFVSVNVAVSSLVTTTE